MNSHRSILEIANAIVNDATTLDQYLRSSVLPQPSFDEDGPRKLSRKDSGRRTRRRGCYRQLKSYITSPKGLPTP